MSGRIKLGRNAEERGRNWRRNVATIQEQRQGHVARKIKIWSKETGIDVTTPLDEFVAPLLEKAKSSAVAHKLFEPAQSFATPAKLTPTGVMMVAAASLTTGLAARSLAAQADALAPAPANSLMADASVPVQPVAAASLAPSFDVAAKAQALQHGRQLRQSSAVDTDIANLANAGSAAYTEQSYAGLGTNKASLVSALSSMNPPASSYETLLVLAMAAQETNTISNSERDSSKDGFSDGSANFSPLNLNQGLLDFMGVGGTNLAWMNSQASLPQVGVSVVQGVRNLASQGHSDPATALLSYDRGGASYGSIMGEVTPYLQAVGTTIKLYQQTPALSTNDVRVQIPLEYLGEG